MINKSKLMLIGTVTALLVSGASLAMAGSTGYGGPNGSQSLVTAPAGGPAYALITDRGAVVRSSVERTDPFGVNAWFNR